MKTEYEILGISPNTSPEEIEKIYRRLILQHHPDRGGTTEAFLAVTAAYKKIKNISEAPKPNVNDFIDTYRGSKDEEEEIVNLYKKYRGDVLKIMQNAILDIEEARVREIIDATDIFKYKKYKTKSKKKLKVKSKREDLEELYAKIHSKESKFQKFLDEMDDRFS